ncbi:MAG TPA: hypothetical protein ENJ95_15870 [Bacteroidetes bacterium]|nr:hypothetical protein [Bacteroidota bacterium]
MAFYTRLFLGFYCLVKNILPKEKNPEAYAIAFMAGALSFIYFAATLYFVKRAATMLETAGVFLVIYAVHHFKFVAEGQFKQIIKETDCSEKLVFRSLLYFFVALSLLMYVGMTVGGG